MLTKFILKKRVKRRVIVLALVINFNTYEKLAYFANDRDFCKRDTMKIQLF